MDAQRFAKLVDQVGEDIDEHTASVLLKTFVSEPDYGTQEEVVGVLREAPAAVRASAILDELPRLAREALEWAYELVAVELRHNPTTFLDIAEKKPGHVKAALLAMYEDEEFEERYAQAKLLGQIFRT